MIKQEVLQKLGKANFVHYLQAIKVLEQEFESALKSNKDNITLNMHRYKQLISYSMKENPFPIEVYNVIKDELIELGYEVDYIPATKTTDGVLCGHHYLMIKLLK